MTATISPPLRDLLLGPASAQLATVMPDGSPQVSQVWVDTDGTHVLISTTEDRQKGRNVRRDPRVAVNVVDQNNMWRGASIRGRVIDITTEGLDELRARTFKKYRGLDTPPPQDPTEKRVMLKILPESIFEIGLQ